MRIRRLKLSGFKSFVEPCELRIEPGLTGVVGPNGCGKSNLLEAIRWAMGEASPKSLRGSGMDDVIFAGTATRAPRDFAEVSILVERRDGETIGGAGESEITRRIERGSGSAYRLDGRDVRAKDIALLFADAATGAHSPALVSQGKVGSIIAAKPTERRLLLEEAAGISGLHARRKDAEQKLRATEANLERLSDLLSDQEARVGALKRQARAAERYRQLSERIRGVEARLVYARWAESDAAARASLAEAKTAEAEVEALQAALAEAQAAQEQATTDLGDRRTSLNEARATATAIAHELASARAGRDMAVRRLDELATLGRSLEADIEREEALRADAGRAIAALEEEAAAIAGRLAGQEGATETLSSELAALEGSSRTAEAALADLLARQAAMHAERRVADASLEAATAQSERVAAESARLAAQLEECGSDEEQQAIRDEALARADRARADREKAEAGLEQAETERSAAAGRRDEMESRLAAARAALAAAVSERDALRRGMDDGGGAAIDSLAADPGYERALAAALGDDSDAAVGGDSPRRWSGSRVASDDPSLAPGLEPLSAHVRAPAELARRLMQIGVADVDSGQPLAVGQRLVTRDGGLRRWDGFVSAGSGAAAAERLIRLNRLAELDRRIPGLEADATEAQSGRDSAVASVDHWRSQAESSRLLAAESEREVRESQRAADMAINALERIAAQRSAIEQRQNDLEPVAKATAEALESARSALDSLPDPARLEDAVESARREAASARDLVADKRADAATLAREAETARNRRSAAAREQAEWRVREADAVDRSEAARQRRDSLAREREGLVGRPGAFDSQIAGLEQACAAQERAIADAVTAERASEAALAEANRRTGELGEGASAARERRAAAKARAEGQEARRLEYARVCLERFECTPHRLPERMGFDGEELATSDNQSALLERLTSDRERIGPVNLVAEQELAEIEEARGKGAEEAEELTQAIHRLRGSIGNLNREGRVRLLEAFERVDAHFRSLFTSLFEGGQAHLALVESEDPLEAGLEIMAQPPGKRLSALTLLSGGEQALTAIALIFALFLTNPAPICVLDEVDAPLDDANVERFCDLLDRMTRETDTRYLIVTHNAVTMSRMHRLYGVTMIEKGVSRLVSVDLGSAGLLAAE